MNENELFAKALKEKLASDIEGYSELPDHKFSHSFNVKMRRLLKSHTAEEGGGYPEWFGVRIPFRKSVAVVLAAVMLAALLVGVTFAAYKLCEVYYIEDRNSYSLLNITNTEGLPERLETRYELGIDLDGYTETVYCDDSEEFWALYKNETEDITISFAQYTVAFYQSVYLNTENALARPVETEVNGHKGIYFEAFNRGKAYIWNNDGYIIEIVANVDRSTLLSIAESVRKAE